MQLDAAHHIMIVARKCSVVVVTVYTHALEKDRVQLRQLIQQRQEIIHIPARDSSVMTRLQGTEACGIDATRA